ncbi:MAG: PEP-CTERM sorting domain-containing protein [Phycisphaerae bacterium]|nr:PEP-CTERM sorting domain-containing protein [Gemmatimonadaceae bacterium]
MSVATVVRRMASSAIISGALLASSAVANAQTPTILPFLGLGGNVSVRYVGSNAGDRSRLFYKIGGVFNVGNYTNLFTNNGVGASTPGSEVNIGPVANGVEVFFRLNNVSQGFAYYSGAASRNPDGFAHVSNSQPGPSGTAAVGGGFYTTAFNFEDRFIPPADMDYNDLNFEIAGVSQSTSVVPEPSTYALMLSGLLVMGITARRRKV